jgi:membrane protein involved in colicin uptake
VCHGQTTCDNNGGLLHCACTQEAEHKAAAQKAAAAAAQAEAEKEAEANDKATEAAKAAAKEEEADKAEAEAAEKATAEREAAEAAAELAAACADTAGEATDVYDYSCSDYPRCLASGDSSYTHDYDDDDFTAADMCAACKKQSCSDNDQDDSGSRGS